MSMAIGSHIRTLAADGYFGKQDLQKAAESLLDGKGATRPELERMLKALENLPEGTRTTPQTMKAAKAILKAAAKNPAIDRARIKDIIKGFPEPRSSSGGDRAAARRSSRFHRGCRR
jgi:hypothetical protein